MDCINCEYAGNRKQSQNFSLITDFCKVHSCLGNDSRLFSKCPDEFKRNNEWSDYIKKLMNKGGITSNWKWNPNCERKRAITSRILRYFLEKLILGLVIPN